MEKEMKKLLMVAVSVGIFLLVITTVSLIMLTPKAQTQESAFSASVPLTDARPVTDITDNIPVLPEIGETPEITFHHEERPEAVIISDRNDGDRLTIQIPMPTSAAIPEVSAIVPPATAPAVRAPTPAPTTAPAAARPVTPAQPAATARPPARTTAPAAPARTVTDYWIQAGAFSAMVRAEDARDLLASRGLVSIIENRRIDGQTWYRVRLGPYTTEREANHWLAIIRKIDGFAESQVRQTVRQQ